MFSQKLKLLRKKEGITQEQLAAAIGVERSSVGKYEGNGNVMPSHEVLAAISNYFGVSLDYLLGNDTTSSKKPADVIRVPVLGYVAAGIPIEEIEDILDYEELSPEEFNPNDQYFGLKIKGDSMMPRIQNGDVVIVRVQPDVDSGEIAIVRVNGDEATCKQLKKHPNGITLISFNPAYEPMFFTNQEVVDMPISVLGKVVELRAKF